MKYPTTFRGGAKQPPATRTAEPPTERSPGRARTICLAVVAVFMLGIVVRLIARGDIINPDALFPALFFLALILGRGRMFLLDWLPFLGLLLGYEALRGIADDVNHRVRWEEVILADQIFGLGAIPSEHLQNWWYTANEVTLLNAATSFTYLLHFVTPVVFAGVLWWRSRRDYWRFTTALLITSFAGFLTFLALPVAPPWMAGNEGLVPHIYRVFPRTMGEMFESRETVDFVWSNFTSNPVAAFPSLHAAFPLLIALTIMRLTRSPWRWVAFAYPAFMGFSIVYGGEHYLVDALAGYAYAVAGFLVAERLIGGPRTKPAAEPEGERARATAHP